MEENVKYYKTQGEEKKEPKEIELTSDPINREPHVRFYFEIVRNDWPTIWKL